MKWRYDRDSRRLDVTNSELDLASLRSLIRKGLIPKRLKAIVYTTPAVILIMRGGHLRRWISGGAFARTDRPCRDTMRSQ